MVTNQVGHAAAQMQAMSWVTHSCAAPRALGSSDGERLLCSTGPSAGHDDQSSDHRMSDGADPGTHDGFGL